MTRQYRSDIDGLRAVAILSVVTYHAAGRWCPGGFTGVDIFFAISGYLIGGNIYAEILRQRFQWTVFYQRRAKRILPAFYVVLIAVLAAGYATFSPHEYRELGASAVAATLSLSNVLFWKTSNYFAPQAGHRLLLMTWSLGVEEQFYLLIPALMVGLSRVRHRLVLPIIGFVILLSFGLACYYVNRRPIADFYLLYSRAWELAAGVGLAIFEADSGKLPLRKEQPAAMVLGCVGMIGVLAPFWMLGPSTPFPGLAALPSVAGAVALMASAGSWLNRKLLSSAPMAFIGRVSYSWYLWHWPVLAWLRTMRGGELPLGWGLGAVALAFGLAVLSYYWIEQPFRASKLSPVPMLLRYAAVSVALLCVCLAVWSTHGFPGRYRSAGALDAEVVSALESECLLDDGQTTPGSIPGCEDPNLAGRQIVLWGDSHAAALTPALTEIARQHGFTLVEYSKAVCPPLMGIGRYYRESPARAAECIAFNQKVMNRLQSDARVRIVALEGYWEAPFDPGSDNGKMILAGDERKAGCCFSQSGSMELFRAALRETILELQNAHKLVVVFGDVPVFDVDPVWRMRTSLIAPRWEFLSLTTPTAMPADPGRDHPNDDNGEERAAREALRDTVLSIPGAEYWDMRSNLCGRDDDCLYRHSDSPFYLDSNHISLDGGLMALRGWSIPMVN
jgi:peptidoglycan/LPS O-acetylase OafA/YrhL